MRTLKIVVEYDGGAYGGWQTQPNADSVQARLEAAIAKVVGRRCPVVGAGRTDAGVHALGQCAHFKTSSALEPERLRRAINYHLPADIVVREACDVPDSFHARFSAVSKTYRYRVVTGDSPPAVGRQYVYFFPFSLSLARMRAGAKFLAGSHDFRAFCAKSEKNPKESYVRAVEEVCVKRSGREIVFTVRGAGFLYKMVRNMVGTLLDLGRGRIKEPADILKIMADGDRSLAGVTAPAHGLCLVEVGYPAEFGPESGGAKPKKAKT